MRNKIFFSGVAILLFIGGAIFVWKEKNLTLNPNQGNENRIGTRLVKVPTTDPKTLAWNEANRDQRTDLPGNFSIYDQAVHWNDHKIVDTDANTFALYDASYAHDSKTVYYQGPTNSEVGEYIYIIQGADVATFQVLHQGYAKDKYHVYLKGEEIKGADPFTFSVVSQDFSFFAKDRNYVYKQNRRLENIDPEWFRILHNQPGRTFMVDDKKVWLEAWFKDGNGGLEIREVVSADPETFVILGGVWGKDKNGAFYGTHSLENSDPNTFEVLSTGYEEPYKLSYAKDKNSVYFTFKKVEDVDIASFQVVDGVWLLEGAFGEDNQSAFRNGESFSKKDLSYFSKGKLPPSVKVLDRHYIEYNGSIYYHSRSTQSADPLIQLDADKETFKVLKSGYASDHINVFYEYEKIAEDPLGAFTVIEEPYAYDSTHVFFRSEIIVGADPVSFTPFRNSNYSRDKNFVYYYDYAEVKKVGADLSTFELVPGGERDYGKDATRVFFRGEEVRDANPGSFKIIGSGLSSYLGYGNAPEYFTYAKDIDSVFCEGVIFTNADVDSFILGGKNGMPQDKDHSFDGCEIRE